MKYNPDVLYSYNPYQIGYKYFYHDGKLKKKEIEIKISYPSFAKGGMRKCYFARRKDNKLYVAKKYMKNVPFSSYLEDMKMQSICISYAKLYNKQPGVSNKK